MNRKELPKECIYYKKCYINVYRVGTFIFIDICRYARKQYYYIFYKGYNAHHSLRHPEMPITIEQGIEQARKWIEETNTDEKLAEAILNTIGNGKS